jgi:hypothetical protein
MTTLNVQDFGAVPQVSSGDQSAAINAALTQARLAADPAITTVFIPAGLWPITNVLLIGSYTRLLLDPAAVVRMDSNATQNMLRSYNAAPVAGYGGEHDITVEGGTWDGNSDVLTNGATMLQFGHCRNVTVRNARLVRSQENHFIEMNATQVGLVEDCYLEGMVEKTEAVQIDLALSATTFPWYGMYDKTPCDQITVRRCTFGPGIGRAVGSHNSATGKFHTNIKVQDCVIQSSTANAAVWALNWGVGCEVDLRGTQNKWLVWECPGSATMAGRLRATFEPLP